MSKLCRAPALAGLALCLSASAACNGASEPKLSVAGAIDGSSTSASSPVPAPSAQNPPAASLPTVTIQAYTTAVLLYEGTGVSTSDAQSVESILTSANISYKAMTSAQINALTAADLATYGMMLVPGGYAGTMSSSLTASAISLIYDAVDKGGMGYLGICAGAFLAGNYGTWGLGLAPNAFDYYVAESQGVTEEAVEITFASGSPNGGLMDLLWYGGPKLDGWGSVIGKYSDGTIAIAQAPLGKGFVMLSGVHPEAPTSWRTGMGDTDTTTQDFAYVVTLVRATLAHQPLPSF